MTRLLLPLVLLAALLLPAPAYAEEPSMLFENYAYGMARSEAEKIPGIKRGEGEMAGELILEGVKWLDRLWNAKFIFDKDQLIEISLIDRFSPEAVKAVRDQMKREQNQLVGIVLDDKAFDLFSLISAGGMEGFNARFNELWNAKKAHSLYSRQYLSTREISPEVLQRATNINQLLGMVESTIKETEMALIGDGEDPMPRYIIVSFTYPVLDVFRNPPEELRGRLPQPAPENAR